MYGGSWKPRQRSGEGDELLIPTTGLPYGEGIKLAGSLSLAVSVPTMLLAFTRYSRDPSWVLLRE
nr:Permease [uncultured bacterium]